MSQRYIDQVIQRFFAELTQAEARAMTLSLRAHLLHEAKRLQETLKALMMQNALQHSEVLLLNALEHFVVCARQERADALKTSCSFLQQEIVRITHPSAQIAPVVMAAGKPATLPQSQTC